MTASATRIRRLAIFGAAALSVCLAAPKVAVAKKRVVVVGFSGARASSFQGSVTKILKKRHRVVSGASYSKQARRMKARRPTTRNVKRVLSRMKADGMLVGSVKRRGARYQLTLRLRSGATGRFTTTFTVTNRGPRLRGKALRTVRDRLLGAVGRLPALGRGGTRGRGGRGGARGGSRGDDDDDEPVVVAEGDDDDDDDGAKPAPKRGDDDDDDDDGGGKAAATTTKKADAPKDSRPPLTDEEKADLLVRGRGMDVSVGVSAIKRSLSFTVSQGLVNEPRGYRINTPVAGGYLVAELFPLAFDMKNRAKTRNLGVSAVYDRVLKIESTLAYMDPATMMNATTALPTTQERWGLGVVYRHNFGKKPTSPTIKLSARYNRLKFTIDKAAAPAGVEVDIPNVDYTYVDPGAALRYPVSDKLALNLEARFLFVTDTGEMQAADQYGSASVTGYDVDAGFEYKLDARLSIRAGGRILAIAYDFDGTGDLVVNRDGDPMTIDVGGALDQYLGGYVTAGYLF